MKMTDARGVDTISTPMLLSILRADRIDPSLLLAHRFTFSQIMEAYQTFAQYPCPRRRHARPRSSSESGGARDAYGGHPTRAIG
jgi:hypothetical protein